jgi:hypothetical protein
LTSINDRLKNLNTNGTVDYTPQRVKVGDPNEVRDRAVAAREATLAPPPEILAQTFGIFRSPRSTVAPDFIEYIFERTTVLGIPACKAYKITEMPFTNAAPDARAGKSGVIADSSRQYSKPVMEIVTIVPCTDKSYTAVTPGSIKAPVPRRASLGPTPTPAPRASPSLAPGR